MLSLLTQLFQERGKFRILTLQLRDKLAGLISSLCFLLASHYISSFLGGRIDVLAPIEQHLRDLKSATDVSIIGNRVENCAGPLTIIANLCEHVVIEEEVDDLQFGDFGDHEI